MLHPSGRTALKGCQDAQHGNAAAAGAAGAGNQLHRLLCAIPHLRVMHTGQRGKAADASVHC